MNNKMADDYMDGLVKEIQSLQSENISLKQQIDHIVEVGDSAYERLQAENERLRKVEEKARAVCETMVCKNTDLADFEGLCDRIDGCSNCELQQLEDALKGGAK